MDIHGARKRWLLFLAEWIMIMLTSIWRLRCYVLMDLLSLPVDTGGDISRLYLLVGPFRKRRSWSLPSLGWIFWKYVPVGDRMVIRRLTAFNIFQRLRLGARIILSDRISRFWHPEAILIFWLIRMLPGRLPSSWTLGWMRVFWIIVWDWILIIILKIRKTGYLLHRCWILLVQEPRLWMVVMCATRGTKYHWIGMIIFRTLNIVLLLIWHTIKMR